MIEREAAAGIAEVRRSRPYHALIGIGLVSYGLLHLVLAWLAIQLVLWKRAEASSEGALSQLGKQPLGGVLLWVMAIGLFTLTLWQAVEATIGRDAPSRDSRLRRRLMSAGRAIFYLALGVLAVAVATGGGSGSGDGEETLSAKLMAVPFGRVTGVPHKRCDGSEPWAIAPKELRSPSSEGCSSGRRSATTRTKQAVWMLRFRRFEANRSGPCC
jgi:hypothetical protein